jgi:hypothetical protein
MGLNLCAGFLENWHKGFSLFCLTQVATREAIAERI